MGTLQLIERAEKLFNSKPKIKPAGSIPDIISLGKSVFGTSWKDGKHIDLLNKVLHEVIEGKVKRLAIMMPPRHAKTTMACQLFVPVFLAKQKDKRVIYTTYEASKAAEWGRKSRDIIERYSDSLGIQLRSDSRASNKWDIAGHRGGMLTAGAGGPLVGSGADVLICDDLLKNNEEADSPVMREKLVDWLGSTAMTRLEPDGAVIMIMHRWRRDDIMGTTLQKAKENGEDWTVLKLPVLADGDDVLGRKPGEVLWPERFSQQEMEERKRTTAPRWWFSLYQQDPQLEEGAEWPADWFTDVWVDDFPKPNDCQIKVLSLDPSKGKTDKRGDYSAYVMLVRGKDGLVYVGADMCNRRHAEKIVHDGLQLIQKHKPDAFVIESNASQDLFGLLFQNESRIQRVYIRFDAESMVDGPVFLKEEHFQSKVGRIRSWGEWFGRREVRFVRSMPQTQLLLDQFMMFPTGGNDPGVDDGPDSAAMALKTALEISYHPELLRTR